MHPRGGGLGAESNRYVDPCDQFKDLPKVFRQIPETPFQAPHRREQRERSRPSPVAAGPATRSFRRRFHCYERAAEAAAQEH
jgi:hypothetical protein